MAKIKSRDLRASLKNKEVSIENAYKLFLRSRKSRCSQSAIRIYTEKQKNIFDGFSRVGVENMIAINPPSIRAVIF